MRDIITFRRLGPADCPLLQGVSDGLFDNPVNPIQAQAFLTDLLHEMVLAFVDDRAVGMASGTILLHPDKPPAMFVNEVGVRDDWQGRGIGADVTRCLFRIARMRGCQGIWLGTERDNAAALALYRKLGGEEVDGVYFGWDGALDAD